MTTRRPQPSPAPSLKPLGQDLATILNAAVMNGPAAVSITDADGIIEYVNLGFTVLTGFARSEAVGRNISLLTSGLMPQAHYKRLWRALRKGDPWTGEFHNRKRNGETYWEQACISVVRDDDGRIRHYLKIAEDVTERKRLEESLQRSLKELRRHKAQLETAYRELAATTRALKASEEKLLRQSLEDALTGFLNRRGFSLELRRMQAITDRQGRGVGFLIIDIDHFKQINDRYGHAAGDCVLKTCAALLRSRLRASDVLCRHGGDEFVIALPLADETITRRTAARILAAVRSHPFSEGEASIPVTVSIGAAYGIPAPAQPLEQILLLADRALYRVKRNGRDGMNVWTPGESDPAIHEPAHQVGDTLAHPCRSAFNMLLAMLDARDPSTGAHCRRVSRIARAIARAMALADDQVELVTQAGALHDIGKVAVSDAILLKRGPLNEHELATMRHHAVAGADILSACPDLKAVSDIVRGHHERLDGSGYPLGLKGKRIALGARILAVADTYDVIRSGRPYAAARSETAARRELRRCSGTLFDPGVVDALLGCKEEVKAALAEHQRPRA